MTQPEFRTGTTASEECAHYITTVIKEKLTEGKKVLWLIPGGSAIAVAVAVSKELEGMDLGTLTITLTDERYGAVGHVDSSFMQLEKSGLSTGNAHVYPFLTGESIDATVEQCEALLQKLIAESEYKIGLFGIGPDGHTSGILPESPAVTDPHFISSYQGGAYLRVTTTPALIKELDEVVVYAVGENKKPTLALLHEEQPLSVQPAQALKQAGKFIIFND